MADELKTEEVGTAAEQRVFTQDELNKIIADRVAREKSKAAELAEKASKYDELSQRLEAEEREKLEKQQEFKQLAEKYRSEVDELKGYKEKYTAWEQSESERIQQAADDLSDAQKELVAALPLAKRMAAIQEFKREETPKPGINSTKGGKVPGVPTLDEVDQIKAKYGPDSRQWKDAYGRWRKAHGYI